MVKRGPVIGAVAVGLLWSCLEMQASAQRPPESTLIAANDHTTGPDAHYQLRSGDVLALDFPFVPDFNQTMTVQPDGFITLRAIGPQRVAGATIPELTER